MTVEEAGNGGTSSGDASLLLGRSGCPVWLNPERFLDPEFNADACVADLRRYVPLATLQNELNSYLATLKTKLVEVINEDYADYVGLSGRLANVEGSVVRMRRPLIELRDKLHAVQEAVRSELNSLNQGLRRRKEVATQRALLELTLEVSHVAAKVEKLLEEVAASDSAAAAAGSGDGAPPSPPPSASPGAAGAASPGAGAGADSSPSSGAASMSEPELLAHCRLLERVAAEVSRLTFLANKGKDLAFVRSLEPRIASHRAALRARLQAALAAALAPTDPTASPPPSPSPSGANGGPAPPAATAASPSAAFPALRSVPAALHALHAAADLCEPGEAEGVVRAVVVAPLVERLIAQHKAAAGHTASLGGLAGLLSTISAGVRACLGPLLEAALAPGSALRGLDLLGGAVLEEVQGALAAAMPGVFSPGVPPAFHANYRATLAWLAGLEAMCATRGSVERLRACPAYASLMRRWNTSVYFSLLYQEIAGELEDVLSSDRLEPAQPAAAQAGGAGPEPLTAVAATLLRCLRRAASPDVVLPPLLDRFLRLALQLSQRYATWLAAAAAARREAAAAAAAGAPPGAVLGGAAAPAGAGGAAAQGAAEDGAAGAGAGATGAAAWAVALPAEELLAAVADAEMVHAALTGPFTTAFLELLSQPHPSPLNVGAAAATAAADGRGGSDGAKDAGAASAVAPVVRSALSEAAEAVRAAGRSLAAALTDEVVERCVTVVRQLKGITATYRMTNKAPPSRASHYVGGVLTPLRALLDAGPARRLTPGVQRELLVLPVAEGVCGRYGSLAEELLSSVRKTESSLKRLKKAKGGEEDSAASAVSDSDKITLQLHLDVEELGRQLAVLLAGAHASQLAAPGAVGAAEEAAAALPSFRRLQEVVAPPPGLLAAQAAGGAAPPGGGGGGLL